MTDRPKFKYPRLRLPGVQSVPRLLCMAALVWAASVFVNACQGQDQDVSLTEIQSRHARLTCVVYLDSYLNLSTDQAIFLENAFEAKWGSDYNRNTCYMIHNGFSLASNVIASLDEKELKSFLSQSQFERFELLSVKALDLTEQLAWIRTNDKAVDPIIDQLTLASSLELDRLTKELDLNERQERRLRIAAKGACAKVLAARSQIKKSDPLGMLANHESFCHLMEGPSFQLAKTALWNNAVSKTLTDEQKEVYLASQKVKFERSFDVVTYSFLNSFERNAAPFTAEEYQGLFDVIKSSLISKAKDNGVTYSPSFYFEAFAVYHEIKDEDIATVLNGEQLEHVKSMMAAARQRNANWKQKKDEEKETTPDSTEDQA